MRGGRAGAAGDVGVRAGREGEGVDAELQRDLAEVVWVAAPAEEADGACSALVGRVGAEAVLLHVRHGFQRETHGPQDQAGDVTPGAEGGLVVFRHVRRVEDGDGQADGPHPEHLEHPEAEEGEELITLIVEAVVLARLQDAKQQKPRQPRAPGDEEERGEDLARAVVGGEGQGDDRQDDEVGAAREIGELVEFEGEGDDEEE